jgi:hypothetical protein
MPQRHSRSDHRDVGGVPVGCTRVDGRWRFPLSGLLIRATAAAGSNAGSTASVVLPIRSSAPMCCRLVALDGTHARGV